MDVLSYSASPSTISSIHRTTFPPGTEAAAGLTVPHRVTGRTATATALVNRALLLSANRRDFERVPKLRVENWLE